MRFAIPLFLFLLTLHPLLAQTGTPDFGGLELGQWRQHLPWQRARHVTQSNTHVYFASDWAVVELDKADRGARYITKVEGLNDIGMQLIRYNAAAEVLLLAYTNSNIDLYRPSDGTVVNLPYIRRNLNISGDKTIYDVAFDARSAYLATGFGVVKLNLDRAEIEYTTFTNVPVRSFALFGGYLYAGTEDGLYRLPADDLNPADFSRWQELDAADGVPAGESIGALAVFNNQLYIGAGRTLLRYSGNAPAETVATNPDRAVYYLTAEGAGLLIAWKQDFNGTIEYLEPGGARYEIHWACEASSPLYAVEDGSKKFWIADDSDQYRFFDLENGNCERFTFNSPYNHQSADLAVGPDGAVYVATPGRATNWSAQYFRNGVYVYDEGQWTRWSDQTFPDLRGTTDSDADMWRVAPHPSLDKVYVGSFVGGVLEFENGAYKRKYVSPELGAAVEAGAGQTKIGGLAFDKDGNLWIANYNAAAPIAVLKADGTIRRFSGASMNNLSHVAIDQNGYKWIVGGLGGNVLVYDSGADIDSPADDRYRVLSPANSALPTSTVNSVAIDLDGDVWLGTAQGVVSFECGSNVFDASCTGRRRIVTVDDFNGYLLETEDVRTIAIDGANRKWFGTTNGIFVMSPDGLTQIARYTSTNSPLFDNTITDIAINGRTGEVWIGTEKGLISLRGEATDGTRINSPTAYAYPNPVQPGYDGPIAIYGLARDANVKITDVAGNLVYEGFALGGQAVWNGRDYLGRPVASGVYLVMATSSETFESPDAIITKVVVLR